MNYYKGADYVFAICAYKESPYLEECIQSIKNQSILIKIIIVTSTPNKFIEELVEKYNLEYYINYGKSEIAGDWNFAYRMAKGRIVTIAHQDDVYGTNFAKEMLEEINKHEHSLIAFSNYGEIRNGKYLTKNRLLNIKRIMLFPMINRRLQEVIFVRRRILSFGSPICCPSVTFVKENLPNTIFRSGYKSNVDWQAWERISRYKGAFVYCKNVLMFHRIHEGSTTTEIIANNGRTKEDYEMFCRFWPKGIARIIEYFYCKGEKSNKL